MSGTGVPPPPSPDIVRPTIDQAERLFISDWQCDDAVRLVTTTCEGRGKVTVKTPSRLAL